MCPSPLLLLDPACFGPAVPGQAILMAQRGWGPSRALQSSCRSSHPGSATHGGNVGAFCALPPSCPSCPSPQATLCPTPASACSRSWDGASSSQRCAALEATAAGAPACMLMQPIGHQCARAAAWRVAVPLEICSRPTPPTPPHPPAPVHPAEPCATPSHST